MSVAFRRARVLGAAAAAVLSLGTADPASAVDTWTVEGRYFEESLFGANSSGSTIGTEADGNIYVGTNTGRIGKFSPALDLIWRRRTKLNIVGASVSSLIIGPDNVVYVGGSTSGDQFAPRRGDDDVWIAKLRTDGTLLGGAQTGGKGRDYLAGMAVEPGGDVIVAADTDGTASVLRRYDPTGLNRWSVSLDTGVAGTVASGVAIDRSGNIYVSGSTGRDLFGPNQGSDDVWLAKYDGDGNLLWGGSLEAHQMILPPGPS